MHTTHYAIAVAYYF